MKMTTSRIVAFALAGAGLASTVYAQRDEAAIAEMSQAYEKLAKPQKLIDAGAAANMLRQIADWRFRLPELSTEEVRQLKLLNLHCAAANGDARRMVEVIDSIAFRFKDDPETQYGLFLSGVANADAKRGLDAVKTIGSSLPRAEQLPWLFWVRGFRQVGQAAPDLDIKLDGARDLNPRQLTRTALALVFWRRADISDPEAFAGAIEPLHKWRLDHTSVRLVGVNCDTPADQKAARQFEGAHNLKWEACENAEEVAKAFGVTEFPTMIIVDEEGLIRAVGRPDAPAMHYALRVTTRYADGDADYFPPRDQDGVVIKVERPASAPVEASAAPTPAGGGDALRDDANAESKLREARAFIRTGMKTKAREILEAVIRDYPGTKQAVEARQRLADL